ncbi:hypothetical protein D3C75_893570 [compost metagenome]
MGMIGINPGVDQLVKIQVQQLRRMALNDKTGILAADVLEDKIAFPPGITDDIDIIHDFAQTDHLLRLHQLVDILNFNRTACCLQGCCRNRAWNGVEHVHQAVPAGPDHLMDTFHTEDISHFMRLGNNRRYPVL